MNTSDHLTLRNLLEDREEIRRFQAAMGSFTAYGIVGNRDAGLTRVPAQFLNNALTNFVETRLANISSAIQFLGITEDN